MSGQVIDGAYVVECKPDPVENGVYSVNFSMWLGCDAVELARRRARDADEATPDITGFLKWDGCINWQTDPECMAHGCGPSSADVIGSAFREVYRQAHAMMPSADWEPR